MKKSLSIEKIILYTVLAILLVFSLQLITDLVNYNGAVNDIKNGNYTLAASKFEALEGFRDSEDLKRYCEIMADYNPEDFVSIYHCYRGLSKIENDFDNKALSEVFVRTSTEVETLYKHYNVSLSVKTVEG